MSSWKVLYFPAKVGLLFYGFLSDSEGTEAPVGTSIVNPRRACAARVTVLGLCVCMSVSSNLASRAIMRPTRNTNGFSVT